MLKRKNIPQNIAIKNACKKNGLIYNENNNDKTLILFGQLKVVVKKEYWDFMCKYRFFTDDPDEDIIQAEFVTGTGITAKSKNLWENASQEFEDYVKDLMEIQKLDINKMARDLLTNEEKYGDTKR